ncbi:MAG TPA: alcohol dehydrogenase catalytic domain-containing protein [Planctomycetota bacterium]|nr:alcohol dehydrogenase catalytic domain-containing protein [Planctomycetota bacterium]
MMAPDALPSGPMRVVACAPEGRTVLESRPRPSPGPGEVILGLRACGLCGTDLFKLSSGTAVPGSVLGHEVVGTVEGLGERLEDGSGGLELGDRVVVTHHVPCGECDLCLRGSETLCAVFRENLLEPGGFSELVLVRERAARLAAWRVPGDVPDEAAVFLEPAACVLRGIHRSGLTTREDGRGRAPCVVVLGAGSMGLLHLLVLRAAIPRVRVLLADHVAERLRLAERLGAESACVPGEEGIIRAVRDATGNFGADAVFDTVGGQAALDASLSLVREGGTMVLFAHAPEGERGSFDLNRLFKNERRIVGTYSGAVVEREEVRRMIESQRLDASVLVTHRLPLSRFAEAVELSRARKALKVLLVPDSAGAGGGGHS